MEVVLVPTFPYPYYFFPQNLQLFFAKRNFFPQTDRMFHRNRRSDGPNAGPDLPILETFLFLITTLRFGGVGAPEGREIVPDIFIQHFSAKSVGCLASHYGWAGPAEKYNFFLQNAIFSAKSKIGGVRTCDFRRM